MVMLKWILLVISHVFFCCYPHDSTDQLIEIKPSISDLLDFIFHPYYLCDSIFITNIQILVSQIFRGLLWISIEIIFQSEFIMMNRKRLTVRQRRERSKIMPKKILSKQEAKRNYKKVRNLGYSLYQTSPDLKWS